MCKDKIRTIIKILKSGLSNKYGLVGIHLIQMASKITHRNFDFD